MEHYELTVLKGDEIITAARLIAPDPGAAWSQVMEVAKNIGEPGCRVRVTDEAGDVVILVGIDTARRSMDTNAAV
jgi:hypothetical protein